MEIPFYKFDGAGNDFVVLDNREGRYHLTREQIARICHRRFGVGADGLMTLESADNSLQSAVNDGGSSQPAYDFEMKYYNSDGGLGSMCGNGGRCIALFAYMLGLGDHLHFLAYDGPHDAVVRLWDPVERRAMVDLSMHDVEKRNIRNIEGGFFIDTGSPHFVLQVDDLDAVDVVTEGRRWRNRTDLFPEGTNVDFVHIDNGGEISIRTYERGVEDETLACGTGVTACALLTNYGVVHSRVASFVVDCHETDEAFTEITLTGPASLNFTGTWTFSAQ